MYLSGFPPVRFQSETDSWFVREQFALKLPSFYFNGSTADLLKFSILIFAFFHYLFSVSLQSREALLTKTALVSIC